MGNKNNKWIQIGKIKVEDQSQMKEVLQEIEEDVKKIVKELGESLGASDCRSNKNNK